jgi:hypothetical protein
MHNSVGLTLHQPVPPSSTSRSASRDVTKGVCCSLHSQVIPSTTQNLRKNLELYAPMFVGSVYPKKKGP